MAFMRRLVVVAAVAFLLLLLVVIPSSAAPQDQPVHFATETVVLSSDPVVTTLVNDSVATYRITAVTAEVTADDLPTDGSPTKSHDVAVQFQVDVGDEFQAFVADDAPLLQPGGVLRILLSTPSDTPTGSSGWLTVSVGRSETAELVARQALSLPTAKAATGVTAWSITSMSLVDTSTSIATALPLTKGTCADAGTVSGVLVDGDRTAAVKNTPCSGDQPSIGLEVTGISGVGTYSGTVAVGSDSIEFKVTRTLWWVWPVVAILLGLILAIVAEGATDRGWSREQVRWLGKLKEDGEATDTAFASAAGNAPWNGYRIAGAVNAEVDRLMTKREEILDGRGRWRRYFPWPANFMSAERTALRESTQHVDQVLRDWRVAPDQLKAGDAEALVPELDTFAPKLKARRLSLLAGTTDPQDLEAFERIIVELTSWPAAIQVVTTLAKVKARLDELKPGYHGMVWSDSEVYDAAVRSERAISAAVRSEADADAIAGFLPAVTALVEQVSGLPKIRPVARHELTAGVIGVGVIGEGVSTETIRPGTALSLPAFLESAVAFLSTRGDTMLNIVMVALTVSVAIWSGLSTLYVDKAWGTWIDFVAAFVWGFGTAALLTPILTALRAWGTRVSDAGETT